MRRASGIFRVVLTAVATAICASCESSEATQPTDPLTGLFALTVSADECAEIPEASRVRTYDAQVSLAGIDKYVVTLGGATFLADVAHPGNRLDVWCGAFIGRLDCNQFTASRRGDLIELQLVPNDERHNDEFAGGGGMILERLAPKTVLEIRGVGEGRFQGETLNGTIQGVLRYSPSWPDWHDAITCSTRVRLAFNPRSSSS